MNDLLTVSQVATYYQVGQNTVRIWIKNGALPAIALPHRKSQQNMTYRIRRDRLEKMTDDEKQLAS
jgi:excisionase family DNA binding protein